MLANDPKSRPTAVQVSKHPFFWTNVQRLDFLVTLSDRLEREPVDSPISVALETNAQAVVGRHWDRKLHPSLLEDMGKYRKYDTSSVRDCLRVIRNKKHHFLELSEDIKRILSPMPDGFIIYFEKRFPNLLMHAVRVVSCLLYSEKDFVRAFSSIASLFSSGLSNGRTSFDDPRAIAIDAENLNTIENPTTFDGLKLDPVMWCGSSLATDQRVRGWWRGSTFWETSFSSMHFKSKPRPGHLTKSSADPKYRSRLCSHWELSSGTACPMRRKGKCVFAHGPLELRCKESRREKWGNRAVAEYVVDERSSSGEDVLGAARAIEKIRVTEGSVSEFEKSTKIRAGGGSSSSNGPNIQKKDLLTSPNPKQPDRGRPNPDVGGDFCI
jgi:Ribonuclease 2-5A